MSKRKGQHTQTGSSLVQKLGTCQHDGFSHTDNLSCPPTGVRPPEVDAAILADEAAIDGPKASSLPASSTDVETGNGASPASSAGLTPSASEQPASSGEATQESSLDGPEGDLEVAPTDRFWRELGEWVPPSAFEGLNAQNSETPLLDTFERMRQKRDADDKQRWIDAAFIAFAAKGHPLCKAWKEAHEAWNYRASELAKHASH